MKKLIVTLVLSVCGLQAADVSAAAVDWNSFVRPVPARSDAAARNLWRASVATLATANALDVASSWGKHELNGALAGPSGNFGTQGALIKLAVQGGLLGFESLVLRRHNGEGRIYRILAGVNFAAAAVTGGTAVHNFSISRR
jgi:hypothetical protein